MADLLKKFSRKFGQPPLDYDGGKVYKLGNHWGQTLIYKLEELEAIAKYNGISDWWDHIDPQLEQDENISLLLKRAKNGLPPELEEKYGRHDAYGRQPDVAYERFKAKKEEFESELSTGGNEKPPHPYEHNRKLKTLGAADSSDEEKTSESVKTSDGELVTSELAEKDSPPLGDEFGYASIGRAPEELVVFLNKVQNEWNLPSRRAVIENLIAHEAIVENFEDEDGNRWPEWEAAIEASKHLPVDDDDWYGENTDQ